MDHHDHHNHKDLYIHGVISSRESKAINELDTKINELKNFDFSQWTPEADNKQLYDEYVACCTCENVYCTIKQCIFIKDFEACRSLIESNASDLPECVQLLADYDLLKSL